MLSKCAKDVFFAVHLTFAQFFKFVVVPRGLVVMLTRRSRPTKIKFSADSPNDWLSVYMFVHELPSFY